MTIMTAEEWKKLVSPPKDLDQLLGRIGCKLYPYDRPIIRYVKWSLEHGLIEAVKNNEYIQLSDVPKYTKLNEKGGKALLGVLCALSLIRLDEKLGYKLTTLAEDYLLKDSPYYIGDELHAPHKSIPQLCLQKSNKLINILKLKFVWIMYGTHFGDKNRLENQQTRNIAASIAAVNSGEFNESKSVLDLAGGSGIFSIPLALKYPNIRIVLAELPNAVKNVKNYIEAAGVKSRFELHSLDVFDMPWEVGKFDSIFIGNFLHGFDDESCIRICRESYKHLVPGGRIWLHEMLWNDNKDGPMITALWNVSMSMAGGGQRTYKELKNILMSAGFSETKRVPTATAMEMVGATRP